MENDVDEVNCVNNSSCLCENNIPEASLGDRYRSSLKILELKCWLICRSTSTNKRKPSTQEINIDTMKIQSTSANLL